MADLQEFEPDTTQNDYDNDFERLDANDSDKAIAGENPEEDLYSADPEPPSQPSIPTGDLLGGFGMGEAPQSDPVPDMGGFDSGFGAPIPEAEPTPAFPDSTEPDLPEGDLFGIGIKSSSEPAYTEPEPAQPEPEEPAAPVAAPQPEPSMPSEPEAETSSAPQESSESDTTPALVVDLLYWRDVKKSGVVFGGILFVLIALSLCSFISVVAYLLLAAMTVTISFRVYKSVMQAVQKTGDGNPFKAYLDMDLTLNKDQVECYSSKAVEKINAHLRCLRHLLLVEDLVDSIKFAVVLWLLTYVGAWFNGLTLIILAFISLFSFPIVYEKYQTQIDEAVGKAQTQINEKMTTIKTKIPWLKKKED
ncbi:reticulon-1-A-like isoform X2 [Amphiura filiformis]|uniref:reticulon-1-A-like isoform X2 n=1 Tax=Amphiura filiformis TaxID=82378 RepID=UPI003B227BF7